MGWPGPGHAPQAALLGTSLMVFLSCIEAEQERVVTGHKMNDREKAKEVASCSSSCNGRGPGSGVSLPSIREPKKFHRLLYHQQNTGTACLFPPVTAGWPSLFCRGDMVDEGHSEVMDIAVSPCIREERTTVMKALGCAYGNWERNGGRSRGEGMGHSPIALQDESSQPFHEPSVRFPRTRG